MLSGAQEGFPEHGQPREAVGVAERGPAEACSKVDLGLLIAGPGVPTLPAPAGTSPPRALGSPRSLVPQPLPKNPYDPPAGLRAR